MGNMLPSFEPIVPVRRRRQAQRLALIFVRQGSRKTLTAYAVARHGENCGGGGIAFRSCCLIGFWRKSRVAVSAYNIGHQVGRLRICMIRGASFAGHGNISAEVPPQAQKSVSQRDAGSESCLYIP